MTENEYVTEMTSLTPAEVDALWIEALAPFREKFEKAARLATEGARYRKYGGYEKRAERYEQKAYEMRQEAIALRDEAEIPFKEEWKLRGGWTRAYVVPDGHIHKSRQCHTLYPTTLVMWIPEESGKTEAEIVEYAGIHACTVCYPSAPVDALRAAAKEKQCPGSGSYSYDAFRRTSYTGSGSATCKHCGTKQRVSKAGRMFAHDKKESE